MSVEWSDNFNVERSVRSLSTRELIRLPIHVTERFTEFKNIYHQLSQAGSPPSR
ncbi:hypothetical protein H6F68_10565 [Trichocoleus sp. FACHB-262]|nr:hypothetical protein [Trichocoleus sp. FACHB-262]